MEDFYDVKLTEVDGQPVSLFGVFDGMGSITLLTFMFLLPTMFSFQDLVH